MTMLSAKAQGLNVKKEFKSKTEILEWGKTEFGYVGDTVSFNIDGSAVFVINGDYASGVSYKTVFVFCKYGTEKKAGWSLLCMRNTNTSSVKVEVDKNHKQVVFSSKSGKTLMILPFETLNLAFEKSEQ